ncbi:hypothetical protein ACFL1S_08030 [Pseudomonadota bacterium]
MRYLFLHVPKTAGSMFRAIIQRNFGNEAAIENPFLSTHIYTPSEIDSLFKLYPYRIYSGHVFRLRPALTACDATLQLIAFVRDPVEKARSAYYYLADREMTRDDHLVKRHTFLEMVDYVVSNRIEDSFVLDSSQLDWLVGKQDASLGDVEPSVRDGRLVLLPTEQFDLACVILERLFPADFRDCSYGQKHNVSHRGSANTEDVEREAAQRLPWIEKDRLLYQYAQSNIRTLAGRIFTNPKSLDDAMRNFRQRCANRVLGASAHKLEVGFWRRAARRVKGRLN